MSILKNSLLVVVGVVSVLEIVKHVRQQEDRMVNYARARDSADFSGKPLLIVGSPLSRRKSHWTQKVDYPCGDVTLDSDPFVTSICESCLVGDVRMIPYPNRFFGAVFVSHVLEHLHSIDDFKMALSELYRVADEVYVSWPRPGIGEALVPDHFLRLKEETDGWWVTEKSSGVKEWVALPV